MYVGTSCLVAFVGQYVFIQYTSLSPPSSFLPLLFFRYPLPPPSQDEGIPPLNSSLSVTVRVDPEPPVFNQSIYTAAVPEFTGEVSQQASNG